jgi:hypothetical protein
LSKKLNLVIDQATDFSVNLPPLVDINGDPLNLFGFTASSSMKKWYTSNTVTSFNISINNNAGIITLELNASVSANLYPGRYVYDVNLTNGITTSRVFEGEIFLTAAVTANTILTSN